MSLSLCFSNSLLATYLLLSLVTVCCGKDTSTAPNRYNKELRCHLGTLPTSWSDKSPIGGRLHVVKSKWPLENYLEKLAKLRSVVSNGSSTRPDSTKTSSLSSHSHGKALNSSVATPIRLLFISDSIDRHIVEDACTQAGGKSRWVSPDEYLHLEPDGSDNRYRPPLPTAIARLQKRILLRSPTAGHTPAAANKPGALSKFTAGVGPLSIMSLQCDGAAGGAVKVMVVYLAGVHPTGPYHSPATGNFERRIAIAAALWRRYAGGKPPHLVVTSSLPWDLARMAFFDIPAVYGEVAYGGIGGGGGGGEVPTQSQETAGKGRPASRKLEEGRARRRAQAVRALPLAGASRAALAFAGRGALGGGGVNAREGRAVAGEPDNRYANLNLLDGRVEDQADGKGHNRANNNPSKKNTNLDAINNIYNGDDGDDDDTDNTSSGCSGCAGGYSVARGIRLQSRQRHGRALAGPSFPRPLPPQLRRPLLDSWRMNFTQVLRTSRTTFPKALLYLTHTYALPIQSTRTGLSVRPFLMRGAYAEQLNEETRKTARTESWELMDYRRISDHLDVTRRMRDDLHLSQEMGLEIFNVYINYVCDVTVGAWRRQQRGHNGGGDGTALGRGSNSPVPFLCLGRLDAAKDVDPFL